MHRFLRVALLLVLSAFLVPLPASAASTRFPEVIALPVGFQPEGIAMAPGGTFYVGSIPTGAIYRGDVRTGAGAVLVPAQSGRAAIGLAYDQRHHRLFVAGGPTGMGFVYDAETGADLASFQFVSGNTFVNDVVVTRDAAWFTESSANRQQLYKVPIAPDGTLGAAEVVPLTGDIDYQAGFNANGIDATPSGKTLVIVQTNTGLLFTVDPATGVTKAIDLGGATVTNGDGILLHGRRLYVVRNQNNQVVVIKLSGDLSHGTVLATVTDDDFDVPTTIARFGSRLYVVNARFGIGSPSTAEYSVVQFRKPAGQHGAMPAKAAKARGKAGTANDLK